MNVVFVGGTEDGTVKDNLPETVILNVLNVKTKETIGHYIQTDREVDGRVVFEFVRGI